MTALKRRLEGEKMKHMQDCVSACLDEGGDERPDECVRECHDVR